MQIEFHPEASKEYLDACNWYEKATTGLGKRFKKAITEQITLISDNPQGYPKKYSNYRESVVKVFPFVIVYVVKPQENLIYITAVYHTSRKPGKKYRR